MSTPLNIGILLTGTFPDPVREARGEYDGFFRTMLGSADPSLRFRTVHVEGGEGLPAPDAVDGWIITGSRHGVYEPHDWMEPLKVFIRRIVEARVPLAGVCFGHQVMAEALGGRAVKSDRGWGLGASQYAPKAVPAWVPDALAAPWQSIAIHQDQVVDLPPEASVMASNEHCPYAALVYGDPDKPFALSVQPHPEYTPDLLRQMIVERIAARVAPETAAAALASLDRPLMNDAWAQTFVRFFRQGSGL